LVVDQSDKGGILIRSIVDLAKQLDMRVVAEGVASEDDAIKLFGDGLRLRAEFPVRPADRRGIGSEAAQGTLSGRQAELKQCVPN
jgi:predicted signal transduction protein with EAL and GGDEF domain